ncbi:hypothetical protein I4U23_029300 [Adineta vaga]|nr:hypothetical protein I4U23_029300 [Adineta vaga]
MLYPLFVVCMILCTSYVENSISQIGFQDQSKPICIYLYESILPTETYEFQVTFRVIKDLSICDLNTTHAGLVHQPSKISKELLIIQLLENCSLIQQLIMLRDIDWLSTYFGILFSVNHRSERFEQFLLTYLHDQLKSSLSFSFESNQNIFGFINANEVIRLVPKQSNTFLYRLNRNKNQFDPSIFLIITLVLLCMLIGNEWHRQIFTTKIMNYYQNCSFIPSNNYKDGFIIGFLLFIWFIICFIIDRYLPILIQQIYLVGFIITSIFLIYFCFQNVYSLLFNKIYQKFKVFIAQMRVGNLMICMCIYSFLILFDFIFLIWKGIVDEFRRNLIMIDAKLPMNLWKRNNDKIHENEFIRHLYVNMFENSGFDCLFSGGSMHSFKRNTLKWIVQENLPLIFSFFRWTQQNDQCGIHTGRIYLSMDDIIFPSLLINFCRLFDIGNNIRFRIYYIQALIIYIISFFISFIIMIYSKYDQLSSVMIYSTLLISTSLTGLIRGEFQKLWKGTLTVFNQQQTLERTGSSSF